MERSNTSDGLGSLCEISKRDIYSNGPFYYTTFSATMKYNYKITLVIGTVQSKESVKLQHKGERQPSRATGTVQRSAQIHSTSVVSLL